ncbi:MAG: hypothetical protein L0228_10905 [Planctomycetes bacterium]|nr:hypothetical protein [Planctomycetota bacterium]
MLSYLATATLAISAMLGAPQQHQWESSYGKALEATRAADEPLLVVLDKPNSKDSRLSPELLSDEQVEGADNALLKPYQLCHVDVTTSYGKKVAEAFHAESFPHVAIIDKTGSTVIFSKTGKVQSDEWQQILTRYKTGDRSLAKAVSRTTYKPSSSSSDVLRPNCPSCQRNSF